MTESRIDGVLRARGVLDGDAQRLVRLHCEKGNVQPMVEAISSAMLAVGIASGEIPSNAGVKTKDLLDRAEEAIISAVKRYHEKGGVLIAKGYTSVLGLAAEMAKQWLAAFSPPIPTEVQVKGTLSDPEIQDRLTVVALKLNALLKEKMLASEHNPYLDPESHTYIIKGEDLEGICQRASLEMFRAFLDPNSANHELIHKETP